MNILFKWCLAFFLLSYLPFAGQVSFLINACLFLFVMLTLWQETLKKKVPQIIRVGLMAMGIALVFQDYQTLWGLDPGVAFLSLLAALKLFELNNKRDFFLFVLIVELSLIGHVLTVDHLYMVAYVIFVSMALFGLLFSFHSGHEKPEWNKEKAKVFGQIFGLSVPLAVGLFFIFPRLTLGNLFFNTINKVNYTGFSENLNPGVLSQVFESGNTYFRAKFLEGKTPSYFELYWRGAVLTQTDGFAWDRVKPPGKMTMKINPPVKYRYEVNYDLFMNSPLFLLEDTFKVNVKSKGHRLNLGAGTLKFFPYSNQKISFAAQTGRPKSLKLNDEQRKHYLQLPADKNMKEFKSWVLTNAPQDGDLRNKVKFFSEFLTKEGFIYTLKPGLMSGKAPIDTFFFKAKKGFCEHFASAFALYLRLLEVPSRVVVGFQGGEYNPLGKYYIVRGKDAHAWVEAWDDKRGWVRIDPTSWVSPERIRYGATAFFSEETERGGVSMDVYLEQRSNEFWQGLLFAIDMFYYEANREFVGYDLDRQEDLFSFLGTKSRHWPWKLIVTCFFLASLLFLPLVYQLKKSSETSDDILKAYKKFLKKLHKRGLTVPEYFGPREIESAATDFFPSEEREIRKIIGLFVDIRYKENLEGGQQFKALVRRLKLTKK